MRIHVSPARNTAVAGTICGSGIIALGGAGYGLLVVFGAYVLAVVLAVISED